MVSDVSIQLCHCNTKPARDNPEMNEHDYVEVTLYLRKLKSEFPIIFMRHKILFFLEFFQPLENVKSNRGNVVTTMSLM